MLRWSLFSARRSHVLGTLSHVFGDRTVFFRAVTWPHLPTKDLRAKPLPSRPDFPVTPDVSKKLLPPSSHGRRIDVDSPAPSTAHRHSKYSPRSRNGHRSRHQHPPPRRHWRLRPPSPWRLDRSTGQRIGHKKKRFLYANESDWHAAVFMSATPGATDEHLTLFRQNTVIGNRIMKATRLAAQELAGRSLDLAAEADWTLLLGTLHAILFSACATDLTRVASQVKSPAAFEQLLSSAVGSIRPSRGARAFLEGVGRAAAESRRIRSAEAGAAAAETPPPDPLNLCDWVRSWWALEEAWKELEAKHKFARSDEAMLSLWRRK